MKRVLLFGLILVFCSNALAQNRQTGFDLTQYGVRIEPDKRLIAVLATLEAAGMETALTAEGAKFRGRLQADSGNSNADLRQKIKVFVDQYKRRHPNATNAETIAPFVSMAYALSPAPDLSDPIRTADLPGDLLEVLDFAPLVREYYRRELSGKLDEYVKDYQKAGDALRPSAVEMVSELLEYLRTRPQLTFVERIKTQAPNSKDKKKSLEKIEIRERERRFFIVPEMLAAKGTINFLNIGDDYYVIVPPETDLSSSEARRAFLQFVLDPLVLKNAKDISTFREGIKGLLDERRKNNPEISPDVFLAVLRSLVAAVDARQYAYRKYQAATLDARRNNRKPVSEQTDAQGRKIAKFTEELFIINGKFVMPAVDDRVALELSEAYEKGAVLAFYFADQLKGSEDAGFDIASSLRDMILSFDAAKETNRLAQFADARKRALQAREERRKNATAAGEIIVENPVTKKLLDVDKITQAKNYVQAENELKKLLETNPGESRIYYALGRVASLSAESITDTETRNRRLFEAKVAYENVISSATDKTDSALLFLTYVALARLYEYFGDDGYAIRLYETALKFGDAASEAYKQAVAAREKLMKEQ